MKATFRGIDPGAFWGSAIIVGNRSEPVMWCRSAPP